MAEFDMRPLSLGEQLDRVLSLFRDRFAALILSSLACTLVPMLMMANNFRRLMDLGLASRQGVSPQTMVPQMLALFGKLAAIAVVGLLCYVVLRTALAWITHKALLGDAVDVFGAVEKGFRFFPAMFGLTLVELAIYIMAAMVLYIPAAFWIIGGTAASGAVPAPSAILGLFGVMTVIAAVMLWLYTGFFVTSPVLVCEPDATVFRSIERSWNLTKDRRWPIIGGVVVVIVAGVILQMIIRFGLRAVIGIPAGPEALQSPNLILFFGLNAVVNLLIATFLCVFQMVTYYDLRIRKEGLDLELTAERQTPQ